MQQTRVSPVPAGRRTAALAVALSALLLGACSGQDLSPQSEQSVDPRAGPLRERPAVDGLLFGDEVTFQNIVDGSLFDSDAAGGDAMPVNRYLWQASLDTLSFLPLDSTDPFTGVIATDWSAAASAPNERFKVTVYMLSPALEASSLRVAVFKEVRTEEGLWVAEPSNPETAARLERAILTRARQIRIAALEGGDEAG